IHTDLITPGRYNLSTDPKELARVAFIEHRPEFAREVRKGDVIAAGRNFGCGSSRETAVLALKACGIGAVLANSFARIFYRNAVNNGLLVIQTNAGKINDGDEVEIVGARIKNKTSGESFGVEIPRVVSFMAREGGILKFLKRHSIEELQGVV
ncbi:MAG: 3-isopropylmalate dehydratase, partial [Candidatus Micrarchaeota archaeon]